MKCSLRPRTVAVTVLGVVVALSALRHTQSAIIEGEASVVAFHAPPANVQVGIPSNYGYHEGGQEMYVFSNNGAWVKVLEEEDIASKYRVGSGDYVRVETEETDDTAPSTRRLMQATVLPKVKSISVIRASQAHEVFTGKQIRVKSLIYIFTMCGWNASATVEEINNMFFNNTFNINGYHQTCSYGKVMLNPAENIVLGPIEVPCTGIYVNGDGKHKYNSATGCGASERSAWRKAGEAYAHAKGYGAFVNSTTKRRSVHILPTQAKCRWAGMANVGCGGSGCDAFIRGDFATNLIINMHELGHTHGLMHAGRGNNEYGDATDVMGTAGYSDGYMCLNVGNQFRVGWNKPIATLLPNNTNRIGNAGARGRWVVPSTAVTDVNYLYLNYNLEGTLPNMFVSFRTRTARYDNILASWNKDQVFVHHYNGTTREHDYSRTLYVARLADGDSYTSPFVDQKGAANTGGGVLISVLSINPGVNATVQLCRFTQLNETAATCGDGVDNDCDGLVDEEDPDCSESTPPPPRRPRPPPPLKSQQSPLPKSTPLKPPSSQSLPPPRIYPSPQPHKPSTPPSTRRSPSPRSPRSPPSSPQAPNLSPPPSPQPTNPAKPSSPTSPKPSPRRLPPRPRAPPRPRPPPRMPSTPSSPTSPSPSLPPSQHPLPSPRPPRSSPPPTPLPPSHTPRSPRSPPTY